ncbi:MAG: FAD:protein FMN transferase [Terriglobia bacterium]|jgi:thiamine biosynthesis lipoprotein
MKSPRNRLRIRWLLSGLALALILFAMYSQARRPRRMETSADVMGSAYTVALYGDDQERMKAAMNAAFDEVRRLDRMLSNYRPNSEWSEVNENAAMRPVKVSPELFDLLRACLEYSRQSEGAFDITVGPLMKVWGFYKGTHRLPEEKEVAAALAEVGYRNLILDETAQTVRFAVPGVEMDPGGIGKGYAVDRMIQVLKQNGIHTALVSAAGSSIYAMGAPPSEPRGWHIKIRDPKDKAKTVAEVYLRDESLSTSGNYEKFFEAEGRMYSHIMDPRKGYPAEGMLEVSVIADRTLDSEAWTKPFFVNGRKWASAHKPKGIRVFMCEDNAPCAWVQ